MNEELIKKYKKVYLETKVPEYLLENGLEDLKFRLPEQDKPRHSVFRYGLIFASLFLVISAATVSASQNAKEGDLLWPVRAISEPVIMTVKQNITQNQNKDGMTEIKPSVRPTSPTPASANEDQRDENKKDLNLNNKSGEKQQEKNEDRSENKSDENSKSKDVKGEKIKSDNSGNQVSEEKKSEHKDVEDESGNKNQEAKDKTPGRGNDARENNKK